MLTTKRYDPTESLRLALIGLDAQIAELRETRAQLAALIDQPSADSAAKAAALGRGEGENQRRRKGALGQREKSRGKNSKAEKGGQEEAVKGQDIENPAGPC
jgi:hypothetical protein